MNRKFTKLMAALALLTFLIPPMVGWGQTRDNYSGTFAKCTGTLTSGTYVIGVVENSTIHAINNTVGTSWIKYTDVTISSNQIVNPNEAVVWTYDTETGYIMSVDGTNYIYWTSGNVGCCGTTAYAHDVIESSTSGVYTVTSRQTTERVLRRNGTSGYRYYTSTTGSQAICFFKLDSSPSSDPSLSVSPASIAFGEVAINTSHEETFTVTYANLNQNLTVTGFDGVTVYPETIDVGEGSGEATVTVTYAPAAAGSISGSITVSNTEDDVNATVTVTGSAYDPSSVVYYERVTSGLNDWSGDYIFTGINNSINYYALSGVNSNTNLGTATLVTVSSNGIQSSSTTDAYKVTVAQTTNGYSLYMEDVGYLAYTSTATSSSNYLWALSEFEAQECEWTFSFADGVATITNVYNNGRKLQFNYNQGNPRFAGYTSDQVKITLFKYASTEPAINVAQSVEIEYTAQDDYAIPYSISNPVDGTNLEAVSTDGWISNVTVGTNVVTFDATANEGTSDREGTITLTYGEYDEKVVTVTQGHYVAPVPSITAYPVELGYNATGGSISYNITNPVSGGELTAAVTAGNEGNWLTLGESLVTFSCTTNEGIAPRTATVTLTYTYGDNQTVSANAVVTQNPDPELGTLDHPYTVAQARLFIDGLGGQTSADGIHVSGIISQVDSYNSQYHSITYWISDDGTTTDQLQVYSGKGLNGADFNAVTDVEVSAEVVVKGKLKLYTSGNNSTYEFTQNSQLVVYNAPAVAVEAPVFSPAAGVYAEAQTVTISCETEGATIYYTLDGSEPTSGSNVFDQDLSINSTTTIKAIAIKGEDASSVATATYHIANSASNPYSVPEALAFHEYPTPGIYVHGTVSTAPTQNPTSNGELTYYISIDGEATDQLEVYHGKGLNEAAFTAQDDIQVGDIVTIYGVVQVYGSTIEFASGNYLVEFERPASTEPSITVDPTIVNVDASAHEESLTIALQNIEVTDEENFEVYFYESDGTTVADYSDWFDAEVIPSTNEGYEVYCAIQANAGEARHAYFKVYVMGDDSNEATSELITVNQAKYVADYATLPFAYDGNGQGELPNGLTVYGTGTYGSSPKIQFNNPDSQQVEDYVILHFNEAPGTLQFDIKGNGFSGGTFRVQTSVDGVTYTDKESYTEISSSIETKTISTLASEVRYIKWSYTKDQGNVAFGNINLEAYVAPTQYTLTVTATDHVEILTFVGDATTGIEGPTTQQVYNGTEVGISVSADDFYTLALTVDGNDVTSQLDETGYYSFTMPTHAVTVAATATAVPVALYTYSVNGNHDQENIHMAELNTPVTLTEGVALNDDFTFAGWTLDPNDVSQRYTQFTFTEEKTYTFYAVYAYTTGSAATRDGASYVKVTSTDDLEDGNYLIVYEDGELAFDGSLETLDDTGNYIDVEINNDVIESAQEVDAAVFTIAAIDGGYSIKSASGYYIGNTKTGSKPNGLSASEETVYVNHITFVDSDLTITSSDNEDITSLQFNSTSGQTRFRYFGSTQQPIQLYKYVGGETPTPQPTTNYYTRVFLDETLTGNYTIAGPSIIPAGKYLDTDGNALNSTDADNFLIEESGQLRHTGLGGVQVTMQKSITGYSNYEGAAENGGCWNLIAIPLRGSMSSALTPTHFGLITDDLGSEATSETSTYDLYKFSSDGGGIGGDGKEWRNYRQPQVQNGFYIEPIMGYLYANRDNKAFSFQGAVDYRNGDVSVSDGFDWMLYGNPFPCDAYIILESGEASFYRMNDAGDDFIAVQGAIKPLEGVFVLNSGDFKFSRTAPVTTPGVNVNVNSGSQVIDRAIVSFGHGNMLPKRMLNENNTKLYIPQGTQDYAVVNAQSKGEMPVSFKASKNGTYTISVEPKNMEMTYLHLIDNMTGADIDLLAEPSYTFSAKTSDYASRFRLVFSGSSTSSETAETFAYFNGSEWSVSNMGEATLQVIDMLGRIVSSETINGNATMSTNNLVAGVYVMRLINGENVMTQKIVVR